MTEPAVLQHPCLVPLVRCFGIRLTGSTRCCPWTLAFNIKTALRQPTNTRIRFEISPDNTAYKPLVLAGGNFSAARSAGGQQSVLAAEPHTAGGVVCPARSEEHTSELQSRGHLV